MCKEEILQETKFRQTFKYILWYYYLPIIENHETVYFNTPGYFYLERKQKSDN